MNDQQTITGHQVGKCYWSTYWNEAYLVVSDQLGTWCPMVTVLWEDNHVTTHCTAKGNDPELTRRTFTT